QVDFDGKFEYSTVKVIRSNEAAPITKVYASGSNINIEFNKPVTGNIAVRILNTNGQLVAQQNFQQSQYLIQVTAAGKGAGLYVIQVSDGKGWSESTKLFL
ncbi:MAG TPA: T9SS type A sorting domain-containing protein, partial [Chitinophagaceae bacterium]|nr:T9SS type A sorting domain-containing protein [Chitinophagaceae bacterium]